MQTAVSYKDKKKVINSDEFRVDGGSDKYESYVSNDPKSILIRLMLLTRFALSLLVFIILFVNAGVLLFGDPSKPLYLPNDTSFSITKKVSADTLRHMKEFELIHPDTTLSQVDKRKPSLALKQTLKLYSITEKEGSLFVYKFGDQSFTTSFSGGERLQVGKDYTIEFRKSTLLRVSDGSRVLKEMFYYENMKGIEKDTDLISGNATVVSSLPSLIGSLIALVAVCLFSIYVKKVYVIYHYDKYMRYTAYLESLKK